MEHSSHVLAFQGSAQGAGFCPTGLRALTGNQYTLGGWGQMAGTELGIWLQQQRTSDRFVQKPAQLQVVRRKCQFVAITPGGKEKTEMYTQHSRFLWGFLKDWFLSRLTPSADGTGILWIPGGYRAKQSSAAPVSTGEPVEPQTVIRDSKRLQGPKKETQQTSQTEILYPQAQKDTSLLLV